MSRITMPVESLDNSGSRVERPFPAGPWQGRIDLVRSRDIPTNKEGRVFAGYSSTDGEVLSIQIGSNTPLDGQVDVGESKFFVDIPVRDGDVTLENVDVDERSSAVWQLQRGALKALWLAAALGQTEEVEVDGRNMVTYDTAFIDSLRNGDFDGMEVGFTVRHVKTKSETRPIIADLDGFHTAD